MRNILICIGVIMLGLTACKKDIDIYIPGEEIIGNSDQLVASSANILNVLRPEPNTYSWDASQEYWFQTTGQTTLSFPANAFIHADGEPAIGTVEAEIIEVFTKGDMILYNTPTTSNGRILESAGELFFHISQNGNPLQFAPGKRMHVAIDIPLEDADFNHAMELFLGTEDEEGYFNWVEADQGVADSSTVFAEAVIDSMTLLPISMAYSFVSEHVNWLSVDALVDLPNGGKEVCVFLPAKYDGNNAVNFAVLSSTNSVVQLKWDSSSEAFCAESFPVNEEITIISVAERIDGNYMLGTTTAITSEDLEINIAPSIKSPGDVAEFLSGL